MATSNNNEEPPPPPPPPHPPLRGFFFPFPSPGHMIPLIDIAILLSRRNVSATIITTPANAPLIRPSIENTNSSSLPINLIILPFPPSISPLLPANRENLTHLPPSEFPHLFTALASLRPSLHSLLLHHHADFLLTDNVLTWTADLASDLRIPIILFTGHGAFPLCVHDRLTNRSSTFLTDLPNPIHLTKPEISEIFDHPHVLQMMKQAEEKSFGVVVNSFHEFEPAYADIFRAGRRAWFVGPVSLSTNRGNDTGELMSWLDEQPEGSVVYACFGSLCRFDEGQMREMEKGMEESGERFLWAVRDWEGKEGFEEREEGKGKKGRVWRGWAPQVEILGHAAVGAFVTHCGWNSVMEGVAAGVVLVAWPLMYEQFVNERLVVDVLGVGVRVREGAGEVKGEEVAVAVRRVMGGGEEAEGFRRRAREMMGLAKKAVEVGGSSYGDLGMMVEALRGVQVGREKEGGNVV